MLGMRSNTTSNKTSVLISSSLGNAGSGGVSGCFTGVTTTCCLTVESSAGRWSFISCFGSSFFSAIVLSVFVVFVSTCVIVLAGLFFITGEMITGVGCITSAVCFLSSFTTPSSLILLGL